MNNLPVLKQAIQANFSGMQCRHLFCLRVTGLIPL